MLNVFTPCACLKPRFGKVIYGKLLSKYKYICVKIINNYILNFEYINKYKLRCISERRKNVLKQLSCNFMPF